MKTKNMTTQLLKLSVFFSAALCATLTLANSPVGQWHTLDDKTGEVKSVVVIFEQQGVVRGRVEKVLRKDADPAAK
jgi:hypothetical protein